MVRVNDAVAVLPDARLGRVTGEAWLATNPKLFVRLTVRSLVAMVPLLEMFTVIVEVVLLFNMGLTEAKDAVILLEWMLTVVLRVLGSAPPK